MKELVLCLARWGAWMSTSSDVERGFSKAPPLAC